MNYSTAQHKPTGSSTGYRVSRIQYPSAAADSIQSKKKNNCLIFSYSILRSPVKASGIFDKLRGIKPKKRLKNIFIHNAREEL
jgi:hypothetical protein